MERDRAYQLILDRILDSNIDVDTPLSERKLSESLKIGRTPVREAIRDLIRDGVLESLPARGTFVRVLTAEDIKELYEIRYALEGMASFLAAERGATDALRSYSHKFIAILEAPEKFEPRVKYALGAEFHLEIFRASRNRNLLQIYEPLRIRFGTALGLPQHYDHKRVRESVSEHLSILEAIEASDGVTAQQRICDHLAVGLKARMQIYHTLNRYEPPLHSSETNSGQIYSDTLQSDRWKNHIEISSSEDSENQRQNEE